MIISESCREACYTIGKASPHETVFFFFRSIEGASGGGVYDSERADADVRAWRMYTSADTEKIGAYERTMG